MNERASLSGGECEIDTEPGKGTRIVASWDLSNLTGH
jgi:signal transduction histidine kinase